MIVAQFVPVGVVQLALENLGPVTVFAVGAAALRSKPVAGSEVLVVVPLAKGFSAVAAED